MQRLAGSPAAGSQEEKARWAPLFLPSARPGTQPHPTPDEVTQAAALAWGQGDSREALKQMKEWQKERTGKKMLPWATFPALAGAGPSGDRYEHLRRCMACKSFGAKKKLKKALDNLMSRWAVGDVPASLRWLLDTSLFWLSKVKNGKEIQCEDDEWLDGHAEESILAEMTDEGLVAADRAGLVAGLQTSSAPERAHAVSEAVLLAAWVPADSNIDLLDRKLQLRTADELVGLLEEGPARFCALLQENDVSSMAPEINACEPELQKKVTAQGVRPLVRPIQAGEFLRRFTSKRLLALDRDDFAAIATSMRQFGAGVPGGAEALIHFQKMVNIVARKGLARVPLCRISIDQSNFFGSIDWHAIRAEVAEALPRRAAIEAWKHAEPARAIQGDGAQAHLSDTGTGQGDVDAPMEASLVQGAIARDSRRRVHEHQAETSAEDDLKRSIGAWAQEWDAWDARPATERAQRDADGARHGHMGDNVVPGGHLLDVWYLDDGDVLLDAALAVPFLEAFDASSAQRGVSRNREKTKAVLYMSPDEAEPHSGDWGLSQLGKLASVEWKPDSNITLGCEIGSAEAMASQLCDKTRVVQGMLRKIPLVQDSQIELSLQRACLGASKVNHILRSNGIELARQPEPLQQFDGVQEEGLRQLVPGLGELGVQQAKLPIHLAGLGLRGVLALAPAAALASMVMSRPKVVHLAHLAEVAGLLWAHDIVQEFDSLMNEGRMRVEAALCLQDREALVRLLNEAAQRAAQDWLHIQQGRPASREQAPRLREGAGESRSPELTVASRAGVSPSSGHLRSEPDGQGNVIIAHVASSIHLQREISLMLDVRSLEDLGEKWVEADDRAARRLQELLDPSVSHSWIWNANPCNGSRMSENDFLLGLASRLGARIAPPDAVCRICGEALDSSAGHATCCAGAESTRGHYAVVSSLVDGLAPVDSGVQTEVPGLVPTGERPADILTSAGVPGVKTAMDITVAAPDAKSAGLDACATAFRRKMTKYSRHFPALRRLGIVFRPMVWSAEGRAHPATVRLMDNAVRLFGNRHGREEATAMRARWHHEVGVALQRRKAAMIRAVLPKAPARQRWLAEGGTDDVAHGRLPTIGEESDEDT